MKLHFATGNTGKVKEAQKILSNFQVKQLELNLIEPRVDSLNKISLEKSRDSSETRGEKPTQKRDPSHSKHTLEKERIH